MRRRSAKYRRAVIFLLAVLCVSLVVGSVYAYLKWSAGTVNNTFSIETPIDPTVSETFTSGNTVKKNVAVNVGNPGYSVYVRAAVVITWKNSTGEVLGTKPVQDTDYTLTLGSDKWFCEDGYYYYKVPLSSGTTETLISEVVRLATEPPEADYKLSVEILSQTVQALGNTDVGETLAVTDAWGITVDQNGFLVPTP